jgi:hippurate hydrolase
MSFQQDSALFQRMQNIRRFLHRHPELAYGEVNTAGLICRELDRLEIAYDSGVGGTGVRAVLGSRSDGGCIALRADMDALPLTEETGLEFASTNHGIMHACGHDGHVAMLLGAAEILRQAPLEGQVVLLFQPAEESGNGAAAMIAADCLSGVDMIFGGHIDTHYPVGSLTVDTGLICSYTDPFTITVQGQGGHAAKPHEAVDAVVAGSSLIMNLQTLVSRRINPAHAAVVTIGRFSAGTVHNVIAENAVLDGTIRTGHVDTREQILHSLQRIIRGAAEMCNARINLCMHDGLPAVINDEKSCAVARKAAETVVGRENVLSQGDPSLGGEDFSFYQQVVAGSMIRFGAAPATGAGPAHSSRFDFDERVFPYGAHWLAAVARQGLRQLR